MNLLINFRFRETNLASGLGIIYQWVSNPPPLQVVLYGPRLHLYIMYIIYKLHTN